MSRQKKDLNFEKSVPRCANCKEFIDGGKNVEERGAKRRYHCKRFGWVVTKISICDEWVDRRTGEVLMIEG